MPYPSRPVFAWLVLSSLAACGDARTPTRPANAFEIAVAPLSLPGIGRACYDLRVSNGPAGGGETVWSRGTPGLNGGTGDAGAICSDTFGNGSGGDIAYVAPCDASGQLDEDPGSERLNSVTLWLDGLYDSGGAYIDPDGPSGWRNPCAAPQGCTIQAVCQENADTLVEFNLTVMRSANQGFFDVAVSFEDIFCSAKFDTCYADDRQMRLLFGADDERDWTGVFAVACTTGRQGSETHLMYSDIAVVCGDTIFPIDPTAPAGNNDVTSGAVTLNYGVYRGREALDCGTGCTKLYWNLAFSLDDLAPLGECQLMLSASASDGGAGFSAGLPTRAGAAYPYIDVTATLAPATCQRHALNDGGVVGTVYHGDLVGLPEPPTLCHYFDGTTAGPVPLAVCNGLTCVEGATRPGTTPCGAGGTLRQVCAGGAWTDADTCEEPAQPGFWVVTASVSPAQYSSAGYITNDGFSTTCPAGAINPLTDGNPAPSDPREELLADSAVDLAWTDGPNWDYPLTGFLSRTWCLPALPSDVRPDQFPGMGFLGDGIVDTISFPEDPNFGTEVDWVGSRPAAVELVADGRTWTLFAAGFEVDFFTGDLNNPAYEGGEYPLLFGRKVAIGQVGNVTESWFVGSPTLEVVGLEGTVTYGPVGGRITFGAVSASAGSGVATTSACWAVHGCEQGAVTFTSVGPDLSTTAFVDFGLLWSYANPTSATATEVVVTPPSLLNLADQGWRAASLSVPVALYDIGDTALAYTSFTYRAEPIVDTAIWSYAVAPSGLSCTASNNCAPPCEVDAECDAGQTCDVADGVCRTHEQCDWEHDLCVPTRYRLDGIGTGFRPGMTFTFDDPSRWNRIYMFEFAKDAFDDFRTCEDDATCDGWQSGTSCRFESGQGICAFPDASAVQFLSLSPTSFSLLLDIEKLWQDGEGFFEFMPSIGTGEVAQVRNTDYDGFGGYGSLTFTAGSPSGLLTVWSAQGEPLRGSPATQTITVSATNLGAGAPDALAGVTGTIAVQTNGPGGPTFGPELAIVAIAFAGPSADRPGASDYLVTLPANLTGGLYRITLQNAAAQTGEANFSTRVLRTPWVESLWNESASLRATVEINPWRNYCASNECIPNASTSYGHCPARDQSGHGACNTAADCGTAGGSDPICQDGQCRFAHAITDQCQGAGHVVWNTYVSTFAPNFVYYDPYRQSWPCSVVMGTLCQDHFGAVVRVENYDPALDTVVVVNDVGTVIANVTLIPYIGSNGHPSGLYRLGLSPTAALGNVVGTVVSGELVVLTGGVELDCSSAQYECNNPEGDPRNPRIGFAGGRMIFGGSGSETQMAVVFTGIGSLNAEWVLSSSLAYVPTCANAHVEGSPYYQGSSPVDQLWAHNYCYTDLVEARIGGTCYTQLESGFGFFVYFPDLGDYFALQTTYCQGVSRAAFDAWRGDPGRYDPDPGLEAMFGHALGDTPSGNRVVLW